MSVVELSRNMLTNRPANAERRLDARRMAKWKVEGAWEKKTHFNGQTINVSRTGLRIFTEKPQKVGTKGMIKIKTYFTGMHYDIIAEIEVMNAELTRDGFTCGLKFTKIIDAHKVFLAAYVNGKNPHNAMNAFKNMEKNMVG